MTDKFLTEYQKRRFGCIFIRLNMDSPQNSVPWATPYIPRQAHLHARLQWSGHDRVREAMVGFDHATRDPGSFFAIAGQPSMT